MEQKPKPKKSSSDMFPQLTDYPPELQEAIIKALANLRRFRIENVRLSDEWRDSF